MSGRPWARAVLRLREAYLEHALSELLQGGRASRQRSNTGGRPEERWRAVPEAPVLPESDSSLVQARAFLVAASNELNELNEKRGVTEPAGDPEADEPLPLPLDASPEEEAFRCSGVQVFRCSGVQVFRIGNVKVRPVLDCSGPFGLNT
jgi:hypothetical protein